MSTDEELNRLTRELDEEPEHAFHVCMLSLELFDALAKLHDCDDEARRILRAGSLLHDTGHSISDRRHHKHSRDIIMDTDLPGFSEREHGMVACVARYHRKSHPKKDHKIYADLEERDQEIVSKLAAILRVADGLDRSHIQNTRHVDVVVSVSRVRVSVFQAETNETDIWGAERKSALFEKVFGRVIQFVPELIS